MIVKIVKNNIFPKTFNKKVEKIIYLIIICVKKFIKNEAKL